MLPRVPVASLLLIVCLGDAANAAEVGAKPSAKAAAQSSDDGESMRATQAAEAKAAREKAAQALPVQASTGPVCVATVNASINPGSGDYMIQSIATAQSQQCALLVISLDTPGGLLSTTRDIVKAILSAPLPVAVFVSPPGSVAGSAGVFITLSAHIAAMANGTNIGAAHPVSGGGKDVEAEDGKHMAQKVENDAVAFVESIAIERGRNIEWARKAVKDSESIPAQRALAEKVVDVIALDLGDLLKQLEGRKVQLADRVVELRLVGQEVRHIGMSVSQRFTNAFADPQIAYFLMSFGSLGILMELYHPGAIFPGVFGTICLLLAFISFQVLPINWGGVALVALGFGLLLGEAFITSHGILGIGGGIAVALGGLLLINTQDPNYFVEPNFALGWAQVLPVGMVIAGIAIFVAAMVMRGKLATKPETGHEALVGARAQVREAFGGSGLGLVLLTGELWKAQAEVEAEAFAVGAEVEVVKVEGLKVIVRRV